MSNNTHTREMKTTYNIQFYCRTSKMNKQGLAPVEIGINVSGRRVFCNLPRKERPRDFEKGYDDLSTYLSAMRIRVNEIITEITLNGEPLTSDAIREYLRNGGRKSFTVKRLLSESLDRLRETCHSYGGIRKYEQTIEMFLSVVDPMREASTINPADIKAYVGLLGHYKASSKAMMFTKLKTLLRYGQQEGIITSDPFRNERITRPTPTITFLTEEELDKLRKTEYPNASLERCRDVALFQASCGLAYIDLSELEPGDMQCVDGKYFIRKERHKTGVTFVAPVIDGGEQIYFRYMGRLPVLSNQKYNAYLKTLADLAGIDTSKKTVTSHLLRRTYATRLIGKGVRLEITAKALGHSQPTITLKHYASIQEATVVDEVSKAFGF